MKKKNPCAIQFVKGWLGDRVYQKLIHFAFLSWLRPAGPMDSETPIVRSFVDSNGEEFVEVVVDPESGSTAGDLPSEAVAGPPKAKEVEIVRSAPRVETNYPAELLLNRKAQPGYRVLPGPRNQPTPVLAAATPPKKGVCWGRGRG